MLFLKTQLICASLPAARFFGFNREKYKIQPKTV